MENLTLTVGNYATGNTLNNTLIANDANNVLNGLLGADTMVGKAGDDSYYVDDALDTTVELAGEGLDSVYSTVDYTLIDAAVENLALTGAAAINGTGNDFDNTLTGNSANNVLNGEDGNDVLNGGLGADTLIGDHGDDTFIVDSTGDTTIENAAEGIDTVNSTVSYALSANVENLNLSGSTLIGTGNDLDNIITGGQTLIGGLGNDTLNGGLAPSYGSVANDMYGGAGDDTYYVDSRDRMHDGLYFRRGDYAYENVDEGIDTIIANLSVSINTVQEANVENLTLVGAAVIGTGNALNNVLTGNAMDNSLSGGEGSDTLIGGAGNDSLNGGTGADTMTGGLGNDSYSFDDLGDLLIENAGEGIDTITSSFDYTLSDVFENLTLVGNAVYGTGNNSDNIFKANYYFAAGVWQSYGNILAGGLGNDTYYIDGADTVIELADEGIDTVVSHTPIDDNIPYVMGANIENMIVQNKGGGVYGSGPHSYVVGNELDNVITVDDYSPDYFHGDTINGGAGADTMSGGDGGDTYYVDNIGDVVIETTTSQSRDALYDNVISSVSYTLPEKVEIMTLVGEGLVGTGNAANNTYHINDEGNSIIEAVGGGIDSVYSSVGYTLDANVDNLYLTGAASINGTGNDLGNTMAGNAGSNVLSGGGGDDIFYSNYMDTLIGGSGNDLYIMSGYDMASNVIIENQSEGIDTVFIHAGWGGTWDSLNNFNSYSIYTLGDNVENLDMNTYLINGYQVRGGLYGNDLNNRLMIESLASHSADILDGGAGADYMSGLRGNDTYYVDNVGDVVVEYDGITSVSAFYTYYGYDTVISTASSYTLNANVEAVTLAGVGDINATGNALNNVITGNVGNNVLNGGAGNDTLNGGLGNDTFVFNTTLGSTNVDSIAGFVTGSDAIQLDFAIFGGAGATGVLSSTAFASGAGMTAAATVDQHIIYNSTSGGLYYDADGAGGVASVQFATLVGVPAVTATDFTVA